jgi:hypothetical protein
VQTTATAKDHPWWMNGATNRWAAHNTSFKVAAAGGGGTSILRQMMNYHGG